MHAPTRLAALLLIAALASAAAPASRRDPAVPPPAAPRPLPPIVFVARRVVPAHQDVFGSRLLVRESDGTLRVLLSGDTFFAASHPSVSFDGRRVAFAGRERPTSPWRIWVVNADGTAPAQVTRPDSVPHEDRQPCWIAPRHLAFVRRDLPRDPAGAPAGPADIFVVRDDGGSLVRATAEAHDVEAPVFDPGTGRLVLAGEPVLSVTPGADDLRLAAGDPRSDPGESPTRAAPFEDGRVAVGFDLGRSGSGGHESDVLLFGAADDAGRGGLPRAVGAARPLAEPGTCCPTVLPDGRILIGVISGDPVRLDVVDADGTHREPVVDVPGTAPSEGAAALAATSPRVAVSDSALDARRGPGSATYGLHALNLFAGGAPDLPLPAPPALRDSLRLRVLAALQPGEGGGSSAFLREVPVSPGGEARVDSLPVDTPLMLELLAPDGPALLSAHHAGRTAWANAGPARERRCVGCHAGHSALPVPPDDEAARWFDAAPSAAVTASSSSPGTAGPRAAVDLATRGEPGEVAWVAAGATNEWLRLSWPRALELRDLVLYGVRPGRAGRATVLVCEVVTRLGGTEIARRLVNVPLDPGGTHVGLGLTVADEVEIDVRRAVGALRTSQTGGQRRVAALAEIEAIARVP